MTSQAIKGQTHKATALVISVLLACMPLLLCSSAFAAEKSQDEAAKAQKAAEAQKAEEANAVQPIVDESKLLEIQGDSSGTVLSFDGTLTNALVKGDLAWGMTNSAMQNCVVGNDLLVLGSALDVKNAQVKGDVRGASMGFTMDKANVSKQLTYAGYDVNIGPDAAMNACYLLAGDRVSFEGTAGYAFLYAPYLYFNGQVDGDVVVSAQSIEIGPDAVITGTLHIRSGQNVEVPSTASIAAVNTTQEQANTIEQIDQVRSMVAPFFQIGGAVFTLVSFAILAALTVWLFSTRLADANNLVRRKPAQVIVPGIICVVLLPVSIVIFAVLVFTIPVALCLLLFGLLVLIVAVPFAGAALGQLIPTDKLGRYQKAIVGTVVLTLLSQLPYVNIVLWAVCSVYLLGYTAHVLSRSHEVQMKQEEAPEEPADLAQPEPARASEPTRK